MNDWLIHQRLWDWLVAEFGDQSRWLDLKLIHRTSFSPSEYQMQVNVLIGMDELSECMSSTYSNERDLTDKGLDELVPQIRMALESSKVGGAA